MQTRRPLTLLGTTFTIADICFVLIIFSSALFLRLETLKHHTTPQGDEGSFLSLATNFYNGKGFTNSVMTHYYNYNETLPYPEDTRHPLLAIFMAGLFSLSSPSMAATQLLNLLFSLLSLLLIFIIGIKLHSKEVGFISLIAMAFCWPVISYSVSIYSETLFILLVLCITLIYINQYSKNRFNNQTVFTIGLFVGLSYLCRPNGFILFLSILLVTLLSSQKKLAIPLFIGFFATAGWWMIRNTIIFGSPLYGHYNYFMWIDNHAQLWYHLSKAPPSASAFFSTHSFFSIIEKILLGVINLGTELWLFEGKMLYLTKLLFPFFLWFLISKQSKKAQWLPIGIFLIITLPPLIWIASVLWVSRYVLTFYPFYFLGSAIGLVEAFQFFTKQKHKHLLVPTSFLLIIAIQFFPLKFLTSKRNGDQEDQSIITSQIEWIQKNTPPHSIILTGSLVQQQYRIKRNMIHYPAYEPLEKVLAYGKERGATHFVIDQEFLSRTKTLHKNWYSNNNRINEICLPPHLKLLYEDSTFLVYTIL